MGEFAYPAIDYTDRDYASLRQAMINGIPTRMPEWTSRSPQDFGIVLIELFATMGDILSYYADRVANEAFLSTATQRSSVLRLANLLNYRPRGTTAATAELQFTVDGGSEFDIPANFQVRTRSVVGETPIIFSTSAVVHVLPTIDGESQTVTASAVQGFLTSEEVGASSGAQDQSFQLLQIPVVESSLIVTVTEDETVSQRWTFHDNLLDARPSDNAYTITTDALGVVRIQFGDNVNGRIPPLASVISAVYRVGGGASGNVDASSIIEFVTPLVGVLSVTNVDAAAGGTDVESTTSIRLNAPRSLQAQGRAITLDDYSALAVQVPLVAKARAESNVYSNVTVYVAPFGAQQPTQRMLNDVVNYLSTRKLVGVDVVAASPVYSYIDFNISIQVYDTFSRSQAVELVENGIRAALSFDNVGFGERITLGRIYSIITATGGVRYASITQMDRRGGIADTDVILGPGEIPLIGHINVTALGGTAEQGLAYTVIGGTGTGETPTEPGAPTLVGGSGDYDPEGETFHLVLTWTPSDDATHYFITAQYIDTDHTTVLATHVVGPTSDTTAFAFDLPKNVAPYLRFTAQAYNGDVGPIPVDPEDGNQSIDYDTTIL